MRCASYLQDMIEPKGRTKVIKEAIKKLSKLDFDAIAVRGVSGITAGSILAYALNKQLVVIRKNPGKSHSIYNIEGKPWAWSDTLRYIIVDDLIDSGKTVKHIIRKMENNECVGIYLYCDKQKYFDYNKETRIRCY